MTQTLTTARQQFEEWWHEEYCHLEGSNEAAFVKHVAWEAMQKARELLANREAQPVAWTSQRSLNTKCKIVAFTDDMSALDYGVTHGWKDIVELYPAPPAPAVPDNLAAAVNRLLDCDGTRGHFSAIRCSDSREEVERLLAQPVSPGFKLVPVEPTEEMIAAAMNCDDVEFNSDETFCVNFDNIYRAMLAAAPEGESERNSLKSNDND
ncbi:hypothetical protein [Serratia liquefaciens]|uniref:hypothetical protein n=1 Tax=Serratia liquefaciens TaxID=614 RepID=UPI0021B0BC36|nr:hypothetical protein [Serratia liquefaciens]